MERIDESKKDCVFVDGKAAARMFDAEREQYSCIIWAEGDSSHHEHFNQGYMGKSWTLL